MDLVERVIPADEPVLYEGRAQGYPPLGRTGMGLFFALALGGCLAMTDAGVTVEVGSTSVKIPPVVSLLVAFGAVELFRFAAWRSARYVVTTRRVLAISGVFWQSARWWLQRVGAERVQGSVHWGVELMQLDKLWAPLAGLPLGEVTIINHALATFDATPPASLPPPFWSARRTVAAVMVVLLLLAGAALLRAAPWRVTVAATITPASVDLELDSPVWGASKIDHMDLWYAESDGTLVGRDSESMSMHGGPLRERRTVTGRTYYAIPTSATVVMLHGSVRMRADGREVSFALEVTPGRTATLDLRDLLAAPDDADPPRRFGKTVREWVELLCRDPNEHVRWALLARVNDEVGPRDGSALPALIVALAHDDQDVRYIACKVLASIGRAARDAAPALRDLAERDPDPGVRTTAAETLRAIRPGR